MVYSFGGMSDPGMKAVNQDCASWCLAECGGERIVLLAVCDGMGGLAHGELASAGVATEFEAWFRREISALSCRPDRMDLVRQQWDQLIGQKNAQLCQQPAQMGTALAVLLLWEEDYLLVNVGDVRGYLLRDRLEQLSVDQSYVSNLVATGRLSREEARRHPNRNILLQCIGADDAVEPVFSAGKTRNGDIYLLCSDGLVHEIWDAEIETLLKESCRAVQGDVLQNGIEELIRRARQRGEIDDITAIAVRQDGSPRRRACPDDRGGLGRLFDRGKRPQDQASPLCLERTERLGVQGEGL